MFSLDNKPGWYTGGDCGTPYVDWAGSENVGAGEYWDGAFEVCLNVRDTVG